MRILAIETSCDETAVSILEAEGTEENARFRVLGNALLSQIDMHREYGGVFPAVAKREHAKNLVPLLAAALEEAELLKEDTQSIPDDIRTQVSDLLAREPELPEAFLSFITECEPAEIDAIAVTAGPGLEPALWVGINFARALSLVWNKPLIAVNHMEGHLLSALARNEDDTLSITDVDLPVLALLISGGHTELVSMPTWHSYELIGCTRDDAAGEAFDKVARMLGLPYPGGPEISRIAHASRNSGESIHTFPRPMIKDPHCDFSFSGLKTSVMYLIKGMPELTQEDKEHIARSFEDAVADVLYAKTSRALLETGAKTLVLGGGVSGNTHIQEVFTAKLAEDHPEVAFRIPTRELTTDNAIMIGIAGYYRALKNEFTDSSTLVANGNLSLAK
ncbi:MAG: hypothetical protein JWN64_345 [Parcubacteria group bacterium]|nr:hypothetical protein [Parcubacteria group bacterium]